MMQHSELIERDLEKLGGTPVFAGTRVPLKKIFDYLEAGDNLDVFLDDFPTVERGQAIGVLNLAKDCFENRISSRVSGDSELSRVF